MLLTHDDGPDDTFHEYVAGALEMQLLVEDPPVLENIGDVHTWQVTHSAPLEVQGLRVPVLRQDILHTDRE